MAVYNNISSREAIRRVYDHYDIKTEDWEVRVYDWVNEALSQIKIYAALEDCHTDITISNYKAKLPCDLRVLRAIQIDGIKQDLTHKYSINSHDTTLLKELSSANGTYELNKRGYIISSNEKGIIRIHYKKLPTEFDNELQMEVPLVPDNEDLLTALEWYILYRILARGYIHPVFKIGAQNPELDPSKQWTRWKYKARNSVGRLNKDERDLHKDLWNTMIINVQKGVNYDIKNY